MHMMGYGAAGLGWLWGDPLVGIVMLAGAAGFVVWLIRALFFNGRTDERDIYRPNPLAELQLRLARGEITPGDYEELRAHLRE